MMSKRRTCANKPNTNINFIKCFKCPHWASSNGIAHKYHLQSDRSIYLCSDCHRIRSDNHNNYISEQKRLQQKIDEFESTEEIEQLKLALSKLDEDYNVHPKIVKEKPTKKRAINDVLDDIESDDPTPCDEESIYREIYKHINEYFEDDDVVAHAVAMFKLVNTRKFKICYDDIYVFMPHLGHYVRVGDKWTKNAFNVVTHELFITLRKERIQTFDDGRNELHATAEETAARVIADKHYIKKRNRREHEIVDYANRCSTFICAMNSARHDILTEIYQRIPSKNIDK
uniref:Uncharacterized protein n=1 Tax=viral metagenome TaxID=1070528 RepID=A0A6C0CAN2_9ZZZZ